MLKLIVGLGNPGQDYEKTRHNVGFLFLDKLLEKATGNWIYRSEFEGYVANITVHGAKIILLKPTTFMNKSGSSVGKLVRYFKIDLENLLVVHDELDFEPGVVKLKKNGGHAGHNGLRDIIAQAGSPDFYRLRIGIGRPVGGKKVADYVLSKPSEDDEDLIEAAFVKGLMCTEEMVIGNVNTAMNNLNKQIKTF